jgi:hypothetical protein
MLRGNIKMSLKEAGFEVAVSIHLPQDSGQLRGL